MVKLIGLLEIEQLLNILLVLA